MRTRPWTRTIFGICLAVALIAGLVVAARQDSTPATPATPATSTSSPQASARAEVAQTDLFRQIAEAHGGSFVVENRSDRGGARATLRLPV